MVKYNTKNIKRVFNKVKSNKTYMIIIIALFFLFGKTGVGSKLLTFPLLKYFVLYFIVNHRIKDYWTSLYVVLFVYVCFTIVSYIDVDDKEDLEFDSDDEDLDEE